MDASRMVKREIDDVESIVANFDLYTEEMDSLRNRVSVIVRECDKSKSKVAAKLKARAVKLLETIDATRTK